ncbi:MAG: radical SAM family heme chaperone HemW [Ruminococcus sp.]
MSNTIGLYIHIPFCKSKCPYCDFYSGRASENDYNNYIKALSDNIKFWSKKTDKTVSSVYFGGGTPSILGSERLSYLLNLIKEYFYIADNAEITVEVNPDSGKTLDFDLLKMTGFNRISVGMQSAVEKELKALGRIHGINDAEITAKRAKKAGIDNISLDLMLGIPYQTIESLKKSIDFCANCGVTHISSYILKIESGTVFDKIQNKLELPDEDSQAQLYLFAVDYLKKLGFEQYEISNFAKADYESRHNINYWKCGEYIGIGPSAHSFFEGKRFYYSRNTEDFIKNKTYFDCFGGDKEEFIMLTLRLKSGLNFKEYKVKYNEDFPEEKIKIIRKYADMDYMALDDECAYFTPKGYLVSNAIIRELI